MLSLDEREENVREAHRNCAFRRFSIFIAPLRVVNGLATDAAFARVNRAADDLRSQAQGKPLLHYDFVVLIVSAIIVTRSACTGLALTSGRKIGDEHELGVG
jgi:hypothetical protein